MVNYLVYASIRDAKCDDQQIDKILDSANRNNAKLDVTGVLLYNKKRFIQYLEGDKDTIYNLYEKIQEDDRHKSVMLFGMNQRDGRIFPTWAMAGKDAGTIEIKSSLGAPEKKLYHSLLDGEVMQEDRAMKVIHKLFG